MKLATLPLALLLLVICAAPAVADINICFNNSPLETDPTCSEGDYQLLLENDGGSAEDILVTWKIWFCQPTDTCVTPVAAPDEMWCMDGGSVPTSASCGSPSSMWEVILSPEPSFPCGCATCGLTFTEGGIHLVKVEVWSGCATIPTGACDQDDVDNTCNGILEDSYCWTKTNNDGSCCC